MNNVSSNARSGAQVLVDQLTIQGVDHVFCVPGESYLAVLDAFHDANINITVARQETGAGIMADASARLTGRPGIVFATRGPGAMNAAHAIHIAEHDSTPLILFLGQVGRRMRGRGAFQEMEYEQVFASTAKWVVEIDDPSRIPEIVSRAFHTAMQGRPGPVVISLPEDMLKQKVAVNDAPRAIAAQPAPSVEDMARLQSALLKAQRPVAIIGGSNWSEDACRQFRSFAEGFNIPVVTSFRRTMLMSGDHPNYVGELGLGPNPKLVERIKQSDFVLLASGRMAEVPSQAFTLFEVPKPVQTFVHIHADPEELGRIYSADIAICAAPKQFCAALERLDVPSDVVWDAHTAAAREDYLTFTNTVPELPGNVQMSKVMEWLRDTLPPETIVTNGAGNYTIWVSRYLRFRQFGSLLAPVSGSMGFGLPAAVGAKRVFPHRPVVSFNGDGCFLMNGQEFATAVQYNLPIIVIVVDNSIYGTIRMHQEREYPGRISATSMRSPDFAALGRAYGGHGETVEATEEFPAAFERAVASGLPAIIHIKVDPEAITPVTTLSALREASLQSQRS